MNNNDYDENVIARARSEWANPGVDRLATHTERSLGAIISAREDGDPVREAAIALLLETNRKFLVSFGARMAGRRSGSFDSEDVDQISMKAGLVAARKYDGDHGRFSTYASYWVRQAMQRELFSREVPLELQAHVPENDKLAASLMMQNISLEQELEVSPGIEPATNDQSDPAEVICRADMASKIRQLIDELPSAERTYVSMMMAGYSTAAIAHALGITTRTTYLVRANAFKHMRKAASDEGLEP